MKLTLSAAVVLSIAWLTGSVARADEHHADHHEEHHEEHAAPHQEMHPAPAPQQPGSFRAPPVRSTEHRPEPPRWQPHPNGVHPHGPMVRPHSVRVLRPAHVSYGARQWRHWDHPVFARPHYYWDWAAVHQVTCIAEDSYGDQYPVTEDTWHGFGMNNMTDVEDDALDRCYQESGGDPSCFLATCSHY
ncbi:MAG TPA: hypothetical protein VHO67_23525 [Polyangia bacterium]|nr:hypothetical protein [Polyangia bacterium]